MMEEELYGSYITTEETGTRFGCLFSLFLLVIVMTAFVIAMKTGRHQPTKAPDQTHSILEEIK